MPGRPIDACFLFALPLISLGCSELAGTAGEHRSLQQAPLITHTAPHTTLLTPSSKTLDLGIVPQAGQQHETFSLANLGDRPVEIARIETSCDCLEIRAPRSVIGPGEKVLVQAKLDLSKEPQFLGGLAIEVKGLTSSGGTAFSIVVDVTVRPADEFHTKEGPK